MKKKKSDKLEEAKQETAEAKKNKKIFLLTDGEVENPESVINLAR